GAGREAVLRVDNHIEDGWIVLGDKPGLGIELDEAKLEQLGGDVPTSGARATLWGRRRGAGLFEGGPDEAEWPGGGGQGPCGWPSARGEARKDGNGGCDGRELAGSFTRRDRSRSGVARDQPERGGTAVAGLLAHLRRPALRRRSRRMAGRCLGQRAQ